MKELSLLLLIACIVGCETTGVKNETNDQDTLISEKPVPQKQDEPELIGDRIDSLDVQYRKTFGNGIVIEWLERGDENSEKLSSGDLAQIDYQVELEDQTIIDGNHLIRKPQIPFLVGFGMQTPGWDIALQELRVGDHAKVFIPSNLARGEKGIEGLVPPNSNNILKIRIVEKTKPTRTVDGVKVWLFEENTSNKTLFGEGKEISFHAMVSTPSNPFYVNTFRDNNPFSMKLDDSGLVPGLKKALINAKKADRMFVLVPSEQAYKSKGYQDLVKPNEDLFYNVLIMDVIEL